jgi:hypothetical protein
MAANVAVARDPAGILHRAHRGIVALIMAIGRAMVVQEEPEPSHQLIVF